MGQRIVIYGFLGCGKTTLINHLLRDIFPERRTVVLENESGRESVDGDFLRRGGAQVVDLKAGCVCCTLRSELAQAVTRIEAQMAPDLLILEPSGISALEDLLTIPGFSPDGIVALVDVMRFGMLMRLNPAFYSRQFRLSPVLLLTKTDIAPPEEVFRVRRELERINPDACVVEDYHMLGVRWWSDDFVRYCAGYRAFLLEQTPTRQGFFCETFPLSAPIRIEGLEGLLIRLESEGYMPVRVKGLADTPQGIAKVDAVAMRVELSPVASTPFGEWFLTCWWNEPVDRDLLRGRMPKLIDDCLYG